MAKILCPVCMQSFDEGELIEVNGRRLCASCRTAAEGPVAAAPESVPGRKGLAGLVSYLVADAREWAQGRLWWARLPLLIYLGYVLARHIANPMYRSMFGGINLGIHEIGHYVFAPFGDFLGAFGGTILQCLAPVISTVVFYRQRDYFAIFFCFGWLSMNLFDVARYVGDARAMALPLVTPGGGYAKHDWNYLLGRMNMLRMDTTFEFILRIAATASMIVCFTASFWVLWQMLRPTGEIVEDA